jgi:hypothetical protein
MVGPVHKASLQTLSTYCVLWLYSSQQTHRYGRETESQQRVEPELELKSR